MGAWGPLDLQEFDVRTNIQNIFRFVQKKIKHISENAKLKNDVGNMRRANDSLGLE